MNNKEFVTALAARTDMTAREAGKHAATLMAELARALDENGVLTEGTAEIASARINYAGYLIGKIEQSKFS